ncbi:hypothetical protein IAD21_01308 [Abditibacteriota bacterium]|nr:hypothetical protein IAD21_01308 [Abditibacteriota bacterium]
MRRISHNVPDYPYSHVIGSVAFSPDGHTLAVGTAQRLFLWNWRCKKLLSVSRIRYRAEIDGKLQGTEGDVLPGFLQFSPDGCTLAFQGWELMPVFLFDVAHKRVRRILPIHSEDGNALALRFSPDSRRLLVTSFWSVSASNFDQVHLFDTHTGRVIWHRDNAPNGVFLDESLKCRLAAFSSDGKSIAYSSDERLEVRSARNGQLKFAREFKVRGYDSNRYLRPLPSLASQKKLLPDLAVH